MATKTSRTTDILLRGPPSKQNGAPAEKGSQLQFMQLELTQDIVNELLSCVKSGKPPQVLFGRSPVCH